MINPSFQGVIRPFVLSFENAAGKIGHTKYYLPTAEIKHYNSMTDGRKLLFDEPINNNIKTSKNVRKIATGRGDDYTTGFFIMI